MSLTPQHNNEPLTINDIEINNIYFIFRNNKYTGLGQYVKMDDDTYSPGYVFKLIHTGPMRRTLTIVSTSEYTFYNTDDRAIRVLSPIATGGGSRRKSKKLKTRRRQLK